MDKRIPVAVVGATGAVGQRFVQLLANHPWFRVAALSGSERTEGRPYGEACHWVLDTDMPTSMGGLVVQPSTAEALGCPIAFSALPSSAPASIEEDLARGGVAVFTNASTHRTEPDVPILIPELNPDHLALVDVQRRRRAWPGLLVANSNCTSVPVAFVVRALDRAFGVRHLHVVSLQALSGAGYPGVASLDILDNVVPFVGGEEPKVESEPRRILGRLVGDAVEPAPFAISAQCNRVNVRDGHLVCLSLALQRPAGVPAVTEALQSYLGELAGLDLPSSPRPLIVVRTEEDRPQPRRDRDAGGGMAVTVGRIQPCPVNDVKLIALSHNTVRGAAGGSILNAELAVARGLLGALR